ncbi:MAG TPA: RidA family protein [Planktothrix sp.]|jgi:enamine deaminase RidA (YjgF/YER057c/UK114 family)
MARKSVFSGSPFEKSIGFSRAVRIGNIIAVSGTAPIAEDGKTACPDDLYGQTKRCIEIIAAAIEQAGGSLSDVIRTRIFLTDIDRWPEAAKAHGEYFSDIQPAATMIGMAKLISPDWLIEMEADAVVKE